MHNQSIGMDSGCVLRVGGEEPVRRRGDAITASKPHGKHRGAVWGEGGEEPTPGEDGGVRGTHSERRGAEPDPARKRGNRESKKAGVGQGKRCTGGQTRHGGGEQPSARGANYSNEPP